MKRKVGAIGGGAVVMGLLALSVMPEPATRIGKVARPEAPRGKLIVHEWGTFTSFTGGDGVNLEFRPWGTDDLPPFVMSPPRQQSLLFAKQLAFARQRMETPVIYFYTDIPRTVNVRVDFPQGMLTEWYPVTKRFESGQASAKRPKGRAYLDWDEVRLIPTDEFAGIRVDGPKGQPVPAAPPPVSANDHYGRARQTDSAFVETIDVHGGSHFEKFLFYRGLGDFSLPLKLVTLGHDRFSITNSGDAPTGALFLVRVDRGRIRFVQLDPVSPGSALATELRGDESTMDNLAQRIVFELTNAGLYEKEALAMVNTWRDSWFGENGTRLLYLLPEKEIDNLLPLRLDPAPDERVRILVGRVETLTPEDRKHLVNLFASASSVELPNAVRTELASLGRFAAPTVQFLLERTKEPELRERMERVLSVLLARE